MCVRSSITLAAAALCLVANAAGAALDRPVTVSPGGRTHVETAAALCPTFSWGSVEGAQGYEIVVYEMTSEGTAAPPGQAATLEIAVPGSASSWTPSADGCLEDATAYVWFVRALGKGDAVGDWSQGGMFRTPLAPSPEELEETILRIVERNCQAQRPAGTSARRPPKRASLLDRRAGEERTSTPTPRAVPTPVALALRAEINTIGGITYGVLGISDSSADDSSGVVGVAETHSGAVNGVAGYNRSNEGRGLFAENSAPSGGIAILAHDEPATSTELSAAVVGFTENPNGFGAYFANRVGGIALAVADTDADIIKFSVDDLGQVEAAGQVSLDKGIEVGENIVMSGPGVVQFSPTDGPPACDSSVVGAIYYDLSEAWLCVCTEEAGPTWAWRRADDKTDDCST